MKRAINFIVGFAVGGLMGAAITLLIAPSSGDQLRVQVQARIAGIQDEVKTAAASRRAELETQLETLRKPQ
jgi:gas vesicle protein